MKPKPLAAFFIFLTAFLLPAVARADACWYDSDYSCESYVVYDSSNNTVYGYSLTRDWNWDSYLAVEASFDDPNGLELSYGEEEDYTEVEIDFSTWALLGGYYGIDAEHWVYDDDWCEWIDLGPSFAGGYASAVTSSNIDTGPVWFGGSSNFVHISGTGLVGLIPLITGWCNGSWWLSDTSTSFGEISFNLNVASGLPGACLLTVVLAAWTASVDLEPPPTLSLSGPPGVPLNGTNAFTLSVFSSTQQTVQLSLSTNSGTGSAQFQGGGATKTVNVPVNSGPVSIAVSGTQVSSAANNITLAATVQGSPGSGTNTSFSVVSVSISLNAAGQPASDNAGASSFSGVATTLGPGILTVVSGPYCGVAVEPVGSVSPSDYSGPITLRRTIQGIGKYVGTSQVSAPNSPGDDDTSTAAVQDSDPQSGGSGGTVYDLDGPGVFPGTPPTRIRYNFLEYAVIGNRDSTVSAGNLQYYARVSCAGTSGNPALANDVTGDNQAGSGTTNLTWNLQ